MGSPQSCLRASDDMNSCSSIFSRRVNKESIAQALYTDVLLSIFEFLHLQEPKRWWRNHHDHYRLLPAIRTCKSWYRAGVKVKCQNLHFAPWEYSQELSDLQSLCSSPLRYHVTGLYLTQDIDLSFIGLIRSSLPHLLTLQVQLGMNDMQSNHSSPVSEDDLQQDPAVVRDRFIRDCFPPGLTKLTIRLSRDKLDPSFWQLIIDSIPSAPHLIDLTLSPPNQPKIYDADNSTGLLYQQLNLTSLLSLPMLSSLKWGPSCDHLECYSWPMSLDQIAVIKQIPSLTQFDYDLGALSETHALCSLPHRLQNLKYVGIARQWFDVEKLSQLCNLPSLTQLHPGVLIPTAYPLLARFPQLTSLELIMQCPIPTAAELGILCTALQSCTRLRKLSLSLVYDLIPAHQLLNEIKSHGLSFEFQLNTPFSWQADENSLRDVFGISPWRCHINQDSDRISFIVFIPKSSD